MSAEQILVWIVIGGITGILAEALIGGLRSGLIGAALPLLILRGTQRL